MAVSDFQINAKVRSILSRHWIDLRAVKLGSFRGTVRLSGELYPRDLRDPHALKRSTLEVLETEIRRVPGVSRVYFDLKNWRRTNSGEWVCTAKGTTASSNRDLGESRVYSLKEVRKDGKGERKG